MLRAMAGRDQGSSFYGWTLVGGSRELSTAYIGKSSNGDLDAAKIQPGDGKV